MPELPNPPAAGPVKAGGKAASKLGGRVAGIPTWGWIAAAGTFVFVLVLWARSRTDAEVEVPLTPTEADYADATGLTYDETQLRSAPINYEGNLFGVGGQTGTPSTPSTLNYLSLGKKAVYSIDPFGQISGGTITFPPGTTPGDVISPPDEDEDKDDDDDKKKKKRRKRRRRRRRGGDLTIGQYTGLMTGGGPPDTPAAELHALMV